ncbi:hypothetical protein M3P05_03975 [Sansalvadorimonas sp. 2012CJ34-2]|uniref:Transmembrane protein n=1 Tax=Parendozoicomonas callyspongiae TaxID=2942213 RepID=A0ABT0PCJ6_9GAMM|nr:hypothetical protein [Sansalvadorimonas sp. 2012CJ34-2]MCL6269100.1 hypothetical protein [Sansalvadorimonas sp. 2012CJ34-2]
MQLDRPSPSNHSPAHVSYALMAVSVFTAFPILIAMIVAWINKNKSFDPMLIAHYQWQIRTFWINLLIWLVGLVSIFFLVGYLILFLNQVWLVYRVAIGWYRLANNQFPNGLLP